MKLVFAVAALTVVAEPAFADPLDDAIKARRSFYQVVKFNAGALFAMAKGKMAYDAKAAQSYADNLKALSSLNNGAMWVKGSDNGAKKGKTRAKPEIWSTFPAITEKSNAWKAAVADVASVAGGGLDSLKTKIGGLGGSCKGCHDNFRAKDF